MANINISELPLVSTATDSDVLILNVDNEITNAITFANFKANLNIFVNPGYFPDGTQVAPSISFVNDQNTGLFRPGNDQIGFTTGGSQCGVFNAQGFLGIGVNAPIANLQVAGDVQFDVSNTASVKFDIATGSTDALISTAAITPLLFGVNETESFRIDTEGSTLFGTTVNDDDSQVVVGGQLDVQGALFSNGGTDNHLKIGNDAVTFVEFNAAGAAAFGGTEYGSLNDFLLSNGDTAPPTFQTVNANSVMFDFRLYPNIDTAP